LGLRSHVKGTFHELIEDPTTVAMDKLFVVKENDLVVNITFAWEHAIAIAEKKDEGKLVSHRFPTFTLKEGNDPLFFKHLIRTKRFKYDLDVASPGGAGRNRVLNKTEFMKIKVLRPPYEEQKEISKILSQEDLKLSIFAKLISSKNRLRRTILRKLLTRKVRFSEFNSEWKDCKLIDLLDYEQPSKYIANEILPYSDKSVPVLTANKSFILGYTTETEGIFKNLPVIIFDDFTINNKYVDFPFKVRSSALKILKPRRKDINLRYIFELMQILKIVKGDHKRYYISEYQHIKVKIPDEKEQKQIANFAEILQKEIDTLKKEYDETKKQKRGLMQLLLTGIVKVKVN
jgi:type I restriction enzyme S subunit